MVEEKNASLSTLSVTIQALVVSGKQMTLAVFRQLPIGTLCDKCRPWGVIRYEIKDSGRIWLVHSCEGILYRMAMPFADEEWRDVQEAERRLEQVKEQIEAKRVSVVEIENSISTRADSQSWEWRCDVGYLSPQALEKARNGLKYHLDKVVQHEQELAAARDALSRAQDPIRRWNAAQDGIPQLFIAV